MTLDTKRRRTPPSIEKVIDVESFFPRTSVSSKPHIIDLSDTEDDDDDDDVKLLNFPNTPFRKRKSNSTDNNNNNSRRGCFEKGESSKSNDTPFVCEICTDTKTTKDVFSIRGCSHAYCVDCVAMYVGSKLQENVINIRCPFPGCRGLLEAEDCRSILPPEVFDRWGIASCEVLIDASQKFYCPFGDCSAMLIDDGTEVVRESECPNCRRLFCAQCKVPWHDGIECGEFQKLNEDEREREGRMLMGLAEEMKWMRCPNCRIYVAKSMGCKIMRCRCGQAFCYTTGKSLHVAWFM